MKKNQLVSEIKRFQEIAGIRKEAKSPSYGGVSTVSDFEFELDGKAYIATLDVTYGFEWDREDGAYDYDQEVEVKELGVSELGGDEYTPVTDQGIMLDIRQKLNTDPKLSRQIEDQVDTTHAEPEGDDYDDGDYDQFREGDDYNMGTPSGDTDAMGNIA